MNNFRIQLIRILPTLSCVSLVLGVICLILGYAGVIELELGRLAITLSAFFNCGIALFLVIENWLLDRRLAKLMKK